ncbi:MAG: hypothetical protein ACYDGY_04975 [Acidimicrobiales bacterium]
MRAVRNRRNKRENEEATRLSSRAISRTVIALGLLAVVAIMSGVALAANGRGSINAPSLLPTARKSAQASSSTMPLNEKFLLNANRSAPSGPNAEKLKEEGIRRAEQEAQLPPPPAGPGVPVQGVLDIRQAPFSQTSFEVSNEWTGSDSAITSGLITIYAGIQITNAATMAQGFGGVRVYTTPSLKDVGQYLSNQKSPLKIVSVSGNLVNLVSGTGVQLTFNMVSMSFSAT